MAKGTRITVNEWAAEIQRLMSSRGAQDALTAQELADLSGVYVQTMRVRLRRLAAAGRLERVSKVIECLDGVSRSVAAYRLKGKK